MYLYLVHFCCCLWVVIMRRGRQEGVETVNLLTALMFTNHITKIITKPQVNQNNQSVGFKAYVSDR